MPMQWFFSVDDLILEIMGQSLINKKTCLYFLDGMSLAAAPQVNLSRLKSIFLKNIFSKPFHTEILPNLHAPANQR